MLRNKKMDQKILNDKDSLLNLLVKFKEDNLKDRRRGSMDCEELGVDRNFLLELITNYDGYFWRDMDTDKITHVKFFFTKRNENPVQMAVGFHRITRTDYWDENSNFDYTEIDKMPLRIYLAATKEDYTLQMVQDHIAELLYGLHCTIENSESEVEKYLDTMKKYNKNLPDDLRLWLELR